MNQIKEDKILLSSCLEKIRKGGSTPFLNLYETKMVRSQLKKHAMKYCMFQPYSACEKVILYQGEMPSITCFEILSRETLTHPEILGSLFSHQVDRHFIGDIVLWNGSYYFMVLTQMAEYMSHHFRTVGKYSISLKEVSLDVLADYEQQYEEIELIVTSMRIDTIVARITGYSRKRVLELIDNDEVMRNDRVVTSSSNIVVLDDTFSIRRFGKYSFDGIKTETKRGNYVCQLKKYGFNKA